LSGAEKVNITTPIRVLFVSRSTLYSSPGGDTIQLEKTAESLRRLGVVVDIQLAGETPSIQGYSLIHFFNVIRPADILSYFNDRFQVPKLISTIYVDYSEYESKTSKNIVFRLLGRDSREYLKVIARRVVNNEKISDYRYLLFGQYRSIRFACQNANMLLPNSLSEYKRISKDYKITRPYRVIPNAIDHKIFHASVMPDVRFEGAVLCVARVEGRKNQLNLIRALNGADYPVFIIGSHSPNHQSYYEQCRTEAKENIHFIDHIPHETLPSIYAGAKVHALASWFETTGLCSLEAGAMGCSLVVTDKGDQKEYFNKFAEFCAPDDVVSIREAVDRAYLLPRSTELAKVIREKYTWQRAAEETLSAYREVMGLSEG
jgi:glycosyltransferase involved in cell wall biosynthesis